MVDETPIAVPRNYKSFWAAEWSEWITQENFMLWFGDLTYVTPNEEGIQYTFQNNNLQELTRQYPDVFSPDLIRIYVDFDTSRKGYIEIVDFESLGSYFPGFETYTQGEYLGNIESATKLKAILINKFYDIKLDYDDDEGYYSQGDDRDYDDDSRWRDSFNNDYAYGAEEKIS